jgi:hypothetical protein
MQSIFDSQGGFHPLRNRGAEKRRALAQLGVSDEITRETRAAGHKTMAGVAELLEHIRASGPMRKAPMGFVSRS